MKFEHIAMRLYDGEIIELKRSPDGRYVCPVCGHLNTGDPPYSEDTIDGHTFANASDDICPSCKTQYGFSDEMGRSEEISIKRRWEKLREKWLRSKGCSEDIISNLRNLLRV